MFSDATLAGIHAADPVLLTALTEHGVHWDTIEVRLQGSGTAAAATAWPRSSGRTLLHLLQQRADGPGRRPALPHRRSPSGDVLDAGYDLVIAADGANSLLRDALRGRARNRRSTRRPHGSSGSARRTRSKASRSSTNAARTACSPPTPTRSATGSPPSSSRPTRRRGAGPASTSSTPRSRPDRATRRSRDYLQALFAGQLDGHGLLVNNSRWAAFRTRRAARWTHRVGSTALVLLGDAAHTAHFSVGSGTKMAMEDAIALAASLDQLPHDVDAALHWYEDVRRPQVAKIQAAARQGLSWWETFGRTYDALPPWQFAYHFLTRSLADSKLRQRDPDFVDRCHAVWAAEHGAAPIDSRFNIAGDELHHRFVAVDESSVHLPTTCLPLHDQRPMAGLWALRVEAPTDHDDLDTARTLVAEGVESGASLIAVHGGTALHRRLLTEEARLGHATPGASHRGRRRRHRHDRDPLRSHRPHRPAAVVATSRTRRCRQPRLTWTTRSADAMPTDRTTLQRAARAPIWDGNDRAGVPTRDDIVRRARDLRPILEAGAAGSERDDAVRRVGRRHRGRRAVAHLHPAPLRGWEGGLSAQVDAVIELSAAYPAAGWVLMVTNTDVLARQYTCPSWRIRSPWKRPRSGSGGTPCFRMAPSTPGR